MTRRLLAVSVVDPLLLDVLAFLLAVAALAEVVDVAVAAVPVAAVAVTAKDVVEGSTRAPWN
jgi:hypothetical protein